MSGIELGTFNEVKKLAKRPPAYDMATHAATGFCKPSIILFDTHPGTRSFTIPQGVTKIRAFVVGAGGDGDSMVGGSGGGYSEKEYIVTGGDVFSYTVGASPGGTSSFNSEITSTGGGDGGGIAGSGSGGVINTSGGASTGNGGASSGHRFGDGFGASDVGGAGWGQDAPSGAGGSSGGIDGFGLSILPGNTRPIHNQSGSYDDGASYGCGGGSISTTFGSTGGIGGGGGYRAAGGIGGGGGRAGVGGFGLVGIEVLEVE